MKYFFTLCFFFISYVQLCAQNDMLIVSRDTMSCQIKVDLRKGDYQVFYKDNNSGKWNDIYAENADAVHKANSFYLSLKLPDTEKKVWVRCFFDGVFQLVQYHSRFYVIGPDGIIKLKSNDDIEKEGKRQIRNLFIGQMIAYFNNKVEFDFKKLSYNPKLFVLPMIKYHEENHLSYRDYNNYSKPRFVFNVTAGAELENAELFAKREDQWGGLIVPVMFGGHSSFLNANINVSFPKFSKLFYFSGGIELSNDKVSGVRKLTEGDINYYYEFDHNGINVSFPVRAGYTILKEPKWNVTLYTGLQPALNVYSKATLRVETEINNTVNTQFIDLQRLDMAQLFHQVGLTFDYSIFGKIFSIGGGYNYSLSPKNKVVNTLRKDNSVLFSIGYNF